MRRSVFLVTDHVPARGRKFPITRSTASSISSTTHCAVFHCSGLDTMRNRCSLRLKAPVSLPSSFSHQHAQLTLYRKSGNHGANTTSTTSSACKTRIPSPRPSSSRNGRPNPLPAPTTVNRSAKDNGSACSLPVPDPSSLWTRDI